MNSSVGADLDVYQKISWEVLLDGERCAHLNAPYLHLFTKKDYKRAKRQLQRNIDWIDGQIAKFENQ